MIRRRSSAIFATIAAVLVGTTIAIAQDVTTRGTSVNIRAGAGTEYVVRAVLNNGFSVMATGRSNFDPNISCDEYPNNGNSDQWLRVMHGELEGWVNRCVVEITGDVTGLPVVDA